LTGDTFLFIALRALFVFSMVPYRQLTPVPLVDVIVLVRVTPPKVSAGREKDRYPITSMSEYRPLNVSDTARLLVRGVKPPESRFQHVHIIPYTFIHLTSLVTECWHWTLVATRGSTLAS